MRTNFKKAIMPLAVVVLGAAAAFATNASKQSEKVEAFVTHGYRYDITQPLGQRCVMVDIDCNTIEGPVCTDALGNRAWQFPTESGLQCSASLFKN